MGTPVLVSDLMTREVATIRPDARLAEAGRLMRELHVSGLPVLEDDGRLVGVLSDKDLARKLELSTGVCSPRGLLDLVLDSAPRHGPSLLQLTRRRLENGFVREAMSSPARTINAQAPASVAARAMRTQRFQRLPVVDDRGRLVGILTRADLLASTQPGAPRRRSTLRPAPRRRSGRAPEPFADV